MLSSQIIIKSYYVSDQPTTLSSFIINKIRHIFCKLQSIMMVVIVLSKVVDTKNSSNYCPIERNIESFNSTLLPMQTMVRMETGERKQ